MSTSSGLGQKVAALSPLLRAWEAVEEALRVIGGVAPQLISWQSGAATSLEPLRPDLCPLLQGSDEWVKQSQQHHQENLLRTLADAAGPTLLTCAPGVVHLVFPLFDDEKLAGAIICSAVRLDDSASAGDETLCSPPRPPEELQASLSALPLMTRERLLSAAEKARLLIARWEEAVRQESILPSAQTDSIPAEARSAPEPLPPSSPQPSPHRIEAVSDYRQSLSAVQPNEDNGGRRRKSTRRVVITGVGVVSPIGIGKEAFIQGLAEGRNGIARITLFDPSDMSSQMGGEVKNFDPLLWMDAKTVKRTGRSTQFAVAAAKQAVADAQLNLDDADLSRMGVVIGSAGGGLEFGQPAVERYLSDGTKVISPYLSIIIFAGACSSEVSMELKAKGPSITVSTGCAASNDALGYGFQLIRDGKCDIVIAGGTEAPIFPVMQASFCALRALSTRNHDPEHASRPFDKERDGFVIAEGSAIVVLEELEHARARRAHIYGELLGYAATGDAFHMTRPDPDGAGATRAMQLTLQEAGISPSEVDYISAHGSSTPLNDRTETAAIRSVFGKKAYDIPVSSIKSMIGHSIGAAAAFDLVAVLLGMRDCVIPPTINLEEPDPECDLDYVPNRARRQPYEVVLSNAFGFGGKNACVVVTKC